MPSRLQANRAQDGIHDHAVTSSLAAVPTVFLSSSVFPSLTTSTLSCWFHVSRMPIRNSQPLLVSCTDNFHRGKGWSWPFAIAAIPSGGSLARMGTSLSFNHRWVAKQRGAQACVAARCAIEEQGGRRENGIVVKCPQRNFCRLHLTYVSRSVGSCPAGSQLRMNDTGMHFTKPLNA